VVGRIVRIVPQRPSVAVTFLLTDLEGSTRLREERPKLMGAALADEAWPDSLEQAA
jgi:hypothetical protein